MTMLLRRSMMNKALSAIGWKSVVYTAAADTLKGDTTISALRARLPNSYRYAIALADDTTEPENAAFLGAIFLPNKSEVQGLRYYNNLYVQSKNIEAAATNLILRAGARVTIWWRTEPIESDTPITDWNYSCIQPGPISNALALKTALTNVNTWAAMIAVADLDFRTLPETNNILCSSIAVQNPSWAGGYVKTNNGEYASETQWGSTYDLVIDSTTKIACFYI